MAAVIKVNINKHLALPCVDVVHNMAVSVMMSLLPMFGEITPFIFKLFQKLILSFEGQGPKDLRIKLFFVQNEVYCRLYGRHFCNRQIVRAGDNGLFGFR